MSSETEPSVNGQVDVAEQVSDTKVKKSARIRVTGARGQHENTDLVSLFEKFGEVLKIEPHNYQDGVLVVSMGTVESANEAVADLSGSEFLGEQLSLNNDSAANNTRRNNQQRRQQQQGGPALYRDNYPLRILVNSDLVGAVIGKGGETIKDITNKTKARVDVKRELVQRSQTNRQNGVRNYEKGDNTENQYLSDKLQIVFIFGSPESCSDACKEIMTICVHEAKEKGKEEPDLGILAEDRFCGRIIGKDGKNLNQIREKSGTAIQLSNSPTITTLDSQATTFSLDRIINVRGSLDGLCQAEQFLSSKLRQCHQQEMQMQYTSNFGPQAMYYPPGYHVPPSMMTHGPSGMYPVMPYQPQRMPGPYGPAPHFAPPMPGPPHQIMPTMAPNGMMGPVALSEVDGKVDDALYMRIPNSSAGAVIGTDGVSIKKIMEETKAYVNVSKVNIDSKGSKEGELTQRLVTIKGPPPNQCRAQWHIFQRVRNSSRQGDFDPPVNENDVRLWTILRVPKRWVGRIIGKQGKTVRSVQNSTGCIINLPEESSSPDELDQSVEIYGNFENTQLALTRIRALVSQAVSTNSHTLPVTALPYPPHMMPHPVPPGGYVHRPPAPRNSSVHQPRSANGEKGASPPPDQ